MIERSIRLTDHEVRAVLNGRKNLHQFAIKFPHQNSLGIWEPFRFGGPQGGRTINGETLPEQDGIWHTRTGDLFLCPYGQIGDHLWVQEAFSGINNEHKSVSPDKANLLVYRTDGMQSPKQRDPDVRALFSSRCRVPLSSIKWKPSTQMPRWASRIKLKITAVSVRRLQDISDEECLALGFYPTLTGLYPGSPRATYQKHYTQQNGPDYWDANPWVWLISFLVIGG